MPKKKGAKAKPKVKAKNIARGPSKAEQRRWRAEDLVQDAVKGSPTFKKEVRRVERELAKVEDSVKVKPK